MLGARRDDCADASLDTRSRFFELDANDEWQTQHRYMGVEATEMLKPAATNETLQLAPKAA